MSGSIGGVDASIPLRAGQGLRQNPLAADPGQFANTLNSYNQLQLFPLRQQQMQLQNQGLDIANKTAQLQQNLTRLNAGVGYMLPLLLNPDGTPTTGISAKDIARGLADASHPESGLLTGTQAASLLQTLPDGGSDPVKNRQWLLRMYSENRAAAGHSEAALQMLGMTPTTRDTGQSVVSGGVAGPLTQNPGAFAGQNQTQVYPSRAQLVAPQQYPTPNGTTAYTTGAGYAQAHGQGSNLGPAASAPGTPPAAPTQPASGFPAGYTGQLPPAPSAPPGATLGPSPTTVPVQQASGEDYVSDRKLAGTLAQRTFPLEQVSRLLNDTNTGPGSELANDFRSWLVSAANQGLLPKSVTPDAIQQAKFDELRKYMSQYITGQPFAAGSDARMAAAISGSPNAKLSTLANTDLAKVLIGLERFRSAPYLAFEMQGQGNPDPGKYADFKATFAKQYDPRAFAVDLMGGWNSPKVREMYKSMDEGDRKKFVTSLKMAYSIPGLMQQ